MMTDKEGTGWRKERGDRGRPTGATSGKRASLRRENLNYAGEADTHLGTGGGRAAGEQGGMLCVQLAAGEKAEVLSGGLWRDVQNRGV